MTQLFGTESVRDGRDEQDSHEGQFGAFQQGTTELLHVTVVNVREVVTGLEHKAEHTVGNKSRLGRTKMARRQRHSPST